MNTPHPENFSETPSADSRAGASPLYLLPSWLFFSENVPVERGAAADAVRERVALQIESFAPIPPEQLLSGFRFDSRDSSALCYAAARERLRERLARVPAEALHVLPAFAVWENDSASGGARREWFATDEELTTILFEGGERFPKQVVSWEVSRGNATDAEFYATLNALRGEKRKDFSDTVEDKPGIYLLGKQGLNKKKGVGTIETLRLNDDGMVVAAARVLVFSTQDNSLWFADVRDAETLSKKRTERKNFALARKIRNALIGVGAVLLVLQLALWIFRYNVSSLQEVAASQESGVNEVKSQSKLIDDISKVQENKLQLIRAVAALNAQRPQGVGFTNFSGNGTTGALAVTGNAETIALANEFEKNIRASGLFKDIAFSANIASNGTNFSMQCTPLKARFAEMNFYGTPPTQNEADSHPSPESTNAVSEEDLPEPEPEDADAPKSVGTRNDETAKTLRS